jgi:signal transduction histidine kinase
MKEQIVVVDDERIILELTSMILASKGYAVLTAENALEGLALIARHRPAVVLLDYMMPRMDGLTALRKIRQEYPESYVIMFTGKGSEEIAVELMKAGASDYILKPFNNQDLVERIENVLRLRRIELHNRDLRQDRERLLREVEEWNLELEKRVEQKTLELERAHAEIVQAEKLVALGHLSAGMAHEIRNPLNSISLFAQILQGNPVSEEERLSYAEKVLAEVDRVDALLVRLLAASSSPHVVLEAVDVAGLIHVLLEKFSPQLESQNIETRLDFADHLPFLQAHPDEISQIFSNLLVNAIYEMADGGVLTIALKMSDGGIQAVLKDTGKGIPAEHLSRIFDPFFTTKEKGTGFGLSVVLRIVKTYGGKISVDSNPDQGTTFTVLLPVV